MALRITKIICEDNLNNNDMTCVIFGKGYGIVEDCGGPDSLIKISETHSLESVDLSHFDKKEINVMLLSNMSHFKTLYENER